MTLYAPPSRGRVVALGMLREGTPVEDWNDHYGLWVKREDLACLPPGPPFSKARGVYKHILSRPESVIGVLDTSHSQAGHAVARACQILGKKCTNFYPEYRNNPGPKDSQLAAQLLGASLFGLPAGRSCILYHAAKKRIESVGGYMMPNALKLQESVEETAKEVPKQFHCWEEAATEGGVLVRSPAWVIIPSSSGTIAAGVVRGFGDTTDYIIHLGYSRSEAEVRRYIEEASGVCGIGSRLLVIDEGYQYKDQARPGDTPPWPCNPYYDLKAFRWWLNTEAFLKYGGDVLFWNIG